MSFIGQNAHLVVLLANVFAVPLEVGPDEVLVALVALHLLLLHRLLLVFLRRLFRRRGRFLRISEKRSKRRVLSVPPPSFYLSIDKQLSLSHSLDTKLPLSLP